MKIKYFIAALAAIIFIADAVFGTMSAGGTVAALMAFFLVLGPRE